ncbi:MAG: polyphosphate kinase 1, partial [Acidobacteria bacterium]|nr:polyphosphate kinase 1 [Acidobacteriota bacterium]
LYLNRELIWLNFTRRVLYEAENPQNPILERLKFLAITSSNIDEFFMKRMGGLKQLIAARIQETSVDGRTPSEQMRDCYAALEEIGQKKGDILFSLIAELREHGIHLLAYPDLNEDEKAYLRQYYLKNIFPLVTPQGIDPAHPFPFISNLSLNLLVNLKPEQQSEISMARVKIPVGPDIKRWVRLPDTYRFVALEEIITQNLDLLFPGMEVLACDLFRVTRNANTEKNEEQADDLLELIEAELRDRKFAPIVRLQVMKGISSENKAFLLNNLDLEPADVYETRSVQGKRDLMEIALLDIPALHDPPFHPIDHPRLKTAGNIFDSLREEGPILLFHPYESFVNSVERFLREASEDPKVRAIKMTLYRTASDSKVIHYLLEAAQNGKNVAVVLELKARFDEANNIYWANILEESGIHVTYGVVGLKTHAKLIQVVRMEQDGLRRYSHIGTGNYHAGTARLYTDLGLLTCDDDIGCDLTELLNYLTTGLNPKRNYKKILVAPSDMKKELINKIRREVEFANKGKAARVLIKTNAVDDRDITRELYRAAQSGVDVHLIVRDSCRIRPGIPGLSEKVKVHSIIGRFLEHARLYVFANGGKPEYYLGSSDVMQRNLERRVEMLVPLDTPEIQEEIRKIIQIQWADREGAWEMEYDGSYSRSLSNGGPSSQQIFMELADKRARASGKLKQIHSRGKSKKETWSGY